MGFLTDWFNREPKKEIEKNAPQKQGIVLFFEVLGREHWELCKLNLIMIISCTPIITIPAAITAMSKVMMFMFMDKPVDTFGDFFATFKAEWKRSTLVGLIYIPLLVMTMFGQYFYSNVMENFLLYTISMLASAIVLIVGFYLFPMIAVMDINLRGILKNAILLAFLRMPQNILTLIVMVLLSLFVLLLLPASILIILFIHFAMIGLITNFCAYTALKKFVIQENLYE